MSSRQASRRVCDLGARPDGRSTAPLGRSSVPMASSLSQSDRPAPRPRLRSGPPAPGPRGSPARSRNNTIRAATATSTLTAFSSRSQVSKRRSSTLQPLLSTKWTSSIGHRQVYFRTTSSASSAVAAGSSVQSSQCAAWVPAGGAGSHTSTRFQVIGQACGYFWRSGTNVTRIDRTSTAARRSGTPAFRLTSTTARHRTGWLRTPSPRAPWPAGRRSCGSGHSG